MLTRDETIKLAWNYAEEGYLCSEAVLLALSDCFGVESEIIPKIATGFGAGIARSGEVCGAVVGAILGLGLLFGRNTTSRPTNRAVYWYARSLTDAFNKEYGCLRCPDLLNLDMNKDYEEYQRKGLWVNRCRGIIVSATGMAYEIAADELKLNH
jgi:C_GCAxxG_C_C family probable redox protein